MDRKKYLMISVLIFIAVALLPSGASAWNITGGTITYSGTQTIHKFLSNSTFNISGLSNINVSILVVGGGGAGGSSIGGGGGAGQFYFNSSFNIPSGNYTVTIGRGGNGYKSIPNGFYPSNASFDGQSSIFSTITALGGGGGNGYQGIGRNGASGGGGGGNQVGNGGTGTAGNNGGAGTTTTTWSAGGGGGSRGAGANAAANVGGNGGLGNASAISGTLTNYSCGGGGAVFDFGKTVGNGGCVGNGGNGGMSPDSGADNPTAQDGLNGTGSGGGGGGGSDPGGYGGSGIVIISYNNASFSNVTPIIIITSPASSTYYTTNITLNFTVTGPNSTYPCWMKNDSTLTSLGNVANNTNNISYYTSLGGTHIFNVTCFGGAPSVNVSSVVYPYVWMGLNVSVWNNATGAAMANWTINVTNGTATYGNTSQNTPQYLEWNSTVIGSSNITIDDGSTVLYFFNQTLNRTLNNSAIVQLNISLQPKPQNNISLTSSLGWTLTEGQITTVTCAASELTPQFLLSGIIVGSPYTFSVQNGQYVAGCNALTETKNYAPYNASNTLFVNPLISCTSNSTFAYNAQIATATNQTTLDFSTFVNQKIVRSNLGDVLVQNVNQTWINTTGGYYVIVNNTGITTLNVSFGNYYANKTYSQNPLLGNSYNITAYSQINPYAIYNILHELTGAYFFPPNATITSIIHCSKGETYIPIEQNTTKLLIASSDYIDKATLRVLYSADAYYSRQFYPSASNALILNYYTADAFSNPLDRIDFIVQDTNIYNSKLQIYKTVDNNTLLITEGYFDASHALSAYLLEDVDYYLRTINPDGSITSFDRMTIVAPATKYIGNVKMYLNPNAILIAEKILMNAYTDTNRTTLYVEYNDALNQTNNFTVTIKFQNGTVFQQNTYSSVNSLSANYNISQWYNESFSVYFSVNHQTLGNSPLSFMIPLNPSIVIDIGISTIWYRLFSLAAILLTAGITTRKTLIGGTIITYLVILALNLIGWLNLSRLQLLFTAVVFVLGIIAYHKQGGE